MLSYRKETALQGAL